MKWSEEQISELKEMCFAETPNSVIAKHFEFSVNEIHAKRSQLGITIPKVKAMKVKPAIVVKPDFEAAVVDMEKTLPNKAPRNRYAGLEVFNNAGETCIVLARTGDVALIAMPANIGSPYVVPLQHKFGSKDWWQGRYFSNLAGAWDCYQKAIT